MPTNELHTISFHTTSSIGQAIAAGHRAPWSPPVYGRWSLELLGPFNPTWMAQIESVDRSTVNFDQSTSQSAGSHHLSGFSQLWIEFPKLANISN